MPRYPLHKSTSRFLQHEKILRLRARLPELNFITLHYLYFIGVCLAASLVFYGSSNPDFSITYTDSLFLVISAMTEAGLNTVDLSTMSTFQQVILWLLIVMGSAIWVSVFTVLTRKRYFESRFKDIVRRQKEAKRTHRRSMSEVRERPTSRHRLDEARKVAGPADNSVLEGRQSEPNGSATRPSSTGPVAGKSSDPVAAGGLEKGEVTFVGGPLKDANLDGTRSDPVAAGPENGNVTSIGRPLKDANLDGARSDPDHISFMRYASPIREGQQRTRILSFVGVGANPYSTAFKGPPAEGMMNRGSRRTTGYSADEGDKIDELQYPHYLNRHTTGRNAQFYGLSRAEREHLGGVEYRAITLLAYVVPVYFVLWQLLGCLGLGAYMAYNKRSVAEENGINPWYVTF
jgi:hypothetical protein